ncbi:gamma-glutamyltransferase family protein [Rhizobium paknamense]|nr:gamma-glutamyltransferase family protein [Rhizobium paknamense]
MVTSPHPLASEAGAEVLRQGGTAIEAAVAIGAVLSVVMPHFCGIGGDAVWVLADEKGESRCLLGLGQAARTLPDFSAPIPLRGPGVMLTSASAVESWKTALDFSARHWGGRQSPASLLEAAILYAEEGYEPAASQRFWEDFRREELARWPGFKEIFVEDNGLLRQPQLAASLKTLAAEGLESFYHGALAARLAKGFAEVGSPLTASDLQNTKTREAAPERLDYRGLTLLAPPPPTQGLTTLAIMGILSHFDFSALPLESAERMHLLVEAVKQAFLDRLRIGDPDFTALDASFFLDPQRLAAKAKAIDPRQALLWPQPFRHGETVFFGVVDQQGRAASVLQSTFFDWGSGVPVGDTGILWHNRAASFSVEAGHPNQIRPGKRPFFTLNPGIALKQGRPHLVYGTQGADGQPQTLSVVLNGLIDYGLTPEEALAQPRFLLGRTFSDARDSLKLEGEGHESLWRALGHDVTFLSRLSPIFGQAGVIRLRPGHGAEGAHDPRGEGIALRL